MEEAWPVCSTERPAWLERGRGKELVAIGREVGETSGADPQRPCEGFYSKDIGKALESFGQGVT